MVSPKPSSSAIYRQSRLWPQVKSSLPAVPRTVASSSPVGYYLLPSKCLPVQRLCPSRNRKHSKWCLEGQVPSRRLSTPFAQIYQGSLCPPERHPCKWASHQTRVAILSYSVGCTVTTDMETQPVCLYL